ncbi:FUSC family membrane protein [Paraferrimonas sp. SM1919]|uniref:FUSC family membrane protein n=1 Tax=Paraferrimonas sp. SM1919 TaxID=2662263 RepID=UPI0013D6CDDD|nr:FUSC family membrane protein [Paraferrimonas sp. SM1919]
MLRQYLDQRSIVTSLAFLVGSLPFFYIEQAHIGVGVALGVISSWFSDSATINRHRINDWLISLLLFCATSVWVIYSSNNIWLLGFSFPIVSFLLLYLAQLGPRMGAIGFASVTIGIYTLLMEYSLGENYAITAYLLLGWLSFGICHTIASAILPNQSERDLLAELYSELADKVRTHSQALVSYKINEREQFIETASERNRLISRIRTLRARLEEQLRSGDANQRHSLMLQRLKIAEHLTRQSRLLNLMLSNGIRVDCHNWLLEVNLISHKFSNAIEASIDLRPDSALGLREIDFNKIKIEQLPNRYQQEGQQVIAYLKTLRAMFKKLKTIESPMPATSFKQNPLEAQQKQLWRNSLMSKGALKSSHFRHALRASICIAVGFIMTQALTIEYGVWAMMTSLFVLKPNVSMTWRRLIDRLVGTLLGLAAFGLLSHFNVQQNILIGCYIIGAYGFFRYASRQYAISVFFITLLVFCAFSIMGENNPLLLPRLENTLLGVALPALTVLLISPNWQKDQFNQLFKQATAKYLSYLQALQNDALTPEQISESLYQAVLADNELFNSWQSYLNEPKRSVKRSEGMLICARRSAAILRLLTGLEKFRNNDPLSASQKQLINQIEQAMLWLNDKAQDKEALPNPKHHSGMHLSLDKEIQSLAISPSLDAQLTLLLAELEGFKKLWK